jgi:hypothetical protein
MSKSILELLYFGRIRPAEQLAPSTPQKEDLRRKIEAERECLRNELPPDYHKRIDELMELHTHALYLEDGDIFARGFRMGTLIMLEVLSESCS